MLGEASGSAVVYINGGPRSDGGWIWYSQNNGNPIATGIGFPANQVQFKDLDGDGRADYIGIGKLDGSIVAYANHGPQSGGGWGWTPMNDAKPLASGVGAVGRDVRFGRMEKNGRYSYLALSPNTGALRAWLNGCSELSAETGGSGGGSGGSGGSGSGSGNGSGGNPGNFGGSGNQGNGSGGSGSNGGLDGQYMGGGQEIPAAGLAGLGIPTIGIAAITSLIPFAITAQNALTTASEALKPLAAGSVTGGRVSTAADAVEIAAKGPLLTSQYHHLT